jgi:hypothetical protein
MGASMTGFALKLCRRDDVTAYGASMMGRNSNPSLPMTDPSAA